jgi:hypothetical protein
MQMRDEAQSEGAGGGRVSAFTCKSRYYTCLKPHSSQKQTNSNRIYGVTALEFRFFAPLS